MKLLTVLTSLLLGVLSHAATLTVQLNANEHQCFYGQVEQPNSRIGFFYQVLKGGEFDVDYTIKDPEGKIVNSGDKLKHLDLITTAKVAGDYEFCLSNDMSTFADKFIEFEIQIESSFKAELPDTKYNPDTEIIEHSLSSLEVKVSQITRSLQYYKTRNFRNENTVSSTSTRVFWFSLFELLLMVGMSVVQVVIVHQFFKGARSTLV
ncbi:endosomal cargo receptor Erp3 [Nadsonia fulvescens var. elongata DSM 6958]|uniref:Endosomal cargo receptor Erp3 n=1 Tax=Nadsonia fulvescens var. elongata DSM 6958 TaxID=857566 RepID=A0A1E3PRF9_9ASCO|nr:endosomal cargo receptor Erp3 [Nadsonia fulvescens var. elongata DSM 6958]